MKVRRMIVSVLAAVGAVSLFCAWDFVGMSVSGLNVETGTFKIGGTAVTSTAAELNALDGITATVAELNIMDTVTATASEINAAADASARMTTAVATNTAAITLSASTPYVVFTASGQADTYTNTITLATPYPVGVEFTLINSGSSTNLIKIADSTTVLALGADIELGPTDSVKIFTTGTNTASKVATVCDN